MLPTKKIVASAFAVLIALSSLATAEAAGRYGPAGLGSNIHRRFILKSANKRVQQGKPVRGRASIWLTRPTSKFYRSVPGYRNW